MTTALALVAFACTTPQECRCDAASNLADTSAADAAPHDSAMHDSMQPDAPDADGHDPGDLANTHSTAAPTCEDPAKSVYITPPGLPPFTPTLAGDVVRCADEGTLSVSWLNEQLHAIGHAALAITVPARTWRLAYRTQRVVGAGNVDATLASARIIMPSSGARADAIAVVAHGTVGHSDSCAPSQSLAWSGYLMLPLLARGFAVVAPDYAGLGTDGVAGYMHGPDTAYSVLDAVRAFDRVVPDLAGKPFVVVGHSQGGNAAWAAQGLAEQYGPKKRLKAVVAFAPSHTHTDRTNWLDIPNWPVNPGDKFYANVLYADFAAILGEAQAGHAFAATVRAKWLDALRNTCTHQWDSNFTAPAKTLSELLDPGFVAAVASCRAGRACPAPEQAWIARNQAAIVDPKADGAPIRVIHGAADSLVGMDAISCLKDWGVQHGAPADFCIRAGEDHAQVVHNGYADALAWLDAMLAGKPPSPCAGQGLYKCPWWP